MPFDDKLFFGTAKRNDVAIVALKVNRAILTLMTALQNVRDGKDISKELGDLKDLSDELDKIFDQLTGWTEN